MMQRSPDMQIRDISTPARLRGPKVLEIVSGASHLFPEPGALQAVIDHAVRWFERHLAPTPFLQGASARLASRRSP
jgi:hypothetical protein